MHKLINRSAYSPDDPLESKAFSLILLSQTCITLLTVLNWLKALFLKISEKEGTADKKGRGRRQVEDEGTPHLSVHTAVLISHNTRILNSSHAPFEKKKKKS